MDLFLFLLLMAVFVVGGVAGGRFVRRKFKIDNTELPLVVLSAVAYCVYSAMPPFFNDDGQLHFGVTCLRLLLLVCTIELLDFEAKPLQLKKLTLPSMVPATVGPSYGSSSGNQEEETTIDKINKWLMKRTVLQRQALYSAPVILILSTLLDGWFSALFVYVNFMFMAWIVNFGRKIRQGIGL